MSEVEKEYESVSEKGRAFAKSECAIFGGSDDRELIETIVCLAFIEGASYQLSRCNKILDEKFNE